MGPALSCVLLLGCLIPVAPAQLPGDPSLSVFPARTPPVVGQPFGPLELPTLNGSQTLSLELYRGRKVLLIEFASW